MKKILITGGAGFIGSHVVRYFSRQYPEYHIHNLDALTYAGNLENITDLKSKKNHTFLKADIRDARLVDEIFEKYQFDSVIHLAAESHVDRSLTHPNLFIETNVIGTVNLMNAAKRIWKNHFEGKLFYHISTDEVYGSADGASLFTENTPYNPQSPYAASKAAADHLVRAYHNTYQLPIKLSNCSNNYGPNQFPEKLIPLCIHNILQGKSLPIYGDGNFVRDWLYVMDHVRAINSIFHLGKIGETYNIGGGNQWKNIDLIKLLCTILDKKLRKKQGISQQLITFVEDRPGHDRRYAIDATKLKTELNWLPSISLEEGLEKTVQWYLDHQSWLGNGIK